MNLRLREVPVVESTGGRKEQAIGTPYFRDENLIVHAMHIYPEEDLKNSTEEIEAGSPSAVGKIKIGATRKRSFDDFASLERQRETILRSVVEQMFCSDWSMDTMIEEGDRLTLKGLPLILLSNRCPHHQVLT